MYLSDLVLRHVAAPVYFDSALLLLGKSSTLMHNGCSVFLKLALSILVCFLRLCLDHLLISLLSLLEVPSDKEVRINQWGIGRNALGLLACKL